MSRQLTITAGLIDHVRKFLGEDGAKFFAETKKTHGRYNAVYRDEGSPFPHPVHFREGMQVRNAMREHADTEGWSAHDYDDSWVKVVELCLETKGHSSPVTIELPGFI